ncbi:MAG TPA: hypothetical protein VMQ44_02170 [Candidatus Saccharimonadales bacterium]|nr:hypothetical protein [Candidatus Saccharimonadales bacterium]
MDPIILNVHILAAGFLLADLVFGAISLLRRPYSKERIDNLRLIINTGAVAIIFEIVTGAVLFTQRPQNLASTISFWVKVILLVADVIVGFVFVNRKMKAIIEDEPAQKTKSIELLVWTIVNILTALVIIVGSIKISV